MKKIRIGIIGASGFTGLELIRILENHRFVEISDVLNSETFAGQNVDKLFNEFIGMSLRGVNEMNDEAIHARAGSSLQTGTKMFRSRSETCSNKKDSCEYGKVFSNYSIDEIIEKNLDLIFLATPNGVAMNLVYKFLHKGIKVIDLSADFRFYNLEIFEKTYSMIHGNKSIKGIYGLPEINRNKIKKTKLLANPGCYVTAATLALYPIRKLIKEVIIDGKSGWSGAGRKANPADYEENFVPYKLSGHRHEAEMREKLGVKKLYFSPGVLPFFRGIVNTIHIFPKKGIGSSDIKNTLKVFYKNEQFVKIFDEIPNLKNIKYTNECYIGGFTEKDGRIVLVSMIDNLMKGASGQAIQNMNIMFGFDESEGLLN